MSEQNRIWMIRHPDQSFSRPITEAELMEKFASGGMDPKDEICPATSYWFSIQDVKEMRKHFGNIPMDQLFKKQTDEVTQERYVVTAPIEVPAAHAVKSTQPRPAPVSRPVRSVSETEEGETIQKASPLMKVILAILTLVVLVLLFVWFG